MEGVPDRKMIIYSIIDEQADTTLVDERVVDFFGKSFPSQEVTYSFASQSYDVDAFAQVVTGLKVKGFLENETIELPAAITCPLPKYCRHFK